MAQDATGTPTANWGIPKFLTGTDAPSGKGTNAMMDFIDGIIIPDLLFDAKGDIVAASAADTAVRVPVGTNGQILTADSAQAAGVKWATAAGTVGYGTALPGSPTDGEQFVLVDSTTTPTYHWLFRWNNGSSQTDKWEFIGGAAKVVENFTDSATYTTTSYGSASQTVVFTVPVAGVYDVEWQGQILWATANANGERFHIDFGGAGLTPADATDSFNFLNPNEAGPNHRGQHKRRVTLTTASAVEAKFKVWQGTGAAVGSQVLTVLPVRV